MVDVMDDNDPFEEDIVFDQAGLLGGKSARGRHHATSAGFLPTFLLFSRTIFLCIAFIGLVSSFLLNLKTWCLVLVKFYWLLKMYPEVAILVIL